MNRQLPSAARDNAPYGLGELVSQTAITIPIIPVRGSSVLRGAQAAEIHWQPVVKTVDFN